MSREDRIIHHIHEYERLLLFIRDNPDILERWKSKSLALTRRQAADPTDTNSRTANSRGDK